MNATITKRYTFEAAHHLPYHQGKCHRPHGHSYVLLVSVSGPIKTDEGASDHGMVYDFGDLSAIVKPLVEMLDHQDLNAVLPIYPTAENIAAMLLDHISRALPDGLGDLTVTLYETANSSVTVR